MIRLAEAAGPEAHCWLVAADTKLLEAVPAERAVPLVAAAEPLEASVAPRIAMASVVQAGSAGAGEQQMLLRCLYLNSATGLIGLAAISAPGVRATLPVLLDSRGRGANHSDCVRGQDVSWQITRSAEPHLSAGQQVVLLTPQ